MPDDAEAEIRDGQCYCLLARGRRAKQQENPSLFLMAKTMHVSLFFFLFENMDIIVISARGMKIYSQPVRAKSDLCHQLHLR